MSYDDDNDVLRKALIQPACFFLRKPISPQVLAGVWQHVFRVRKMRTMQSMDGIWEGNNIEINGECPQVQDKVHATDTQNLSVMNQENDEESEIVDQRVNKKPRMSWTDELRLKFEKAIRILGEEKARPKEILKLMNMSNVTLRNVSSHLQKYREKKKRAGINCGTAGSSTHKFKLTNMYFEMERDYQNGKPWDLHDICCKKWPVAGTMSKTRRQYALQQHNSEYSSVHYQIDMVNKLLDKGKGKRISNYDDIKGCMKGGCCKELHVETSFMHRSNPNGAEARIFRHKETLNPAAIFQPYVPDICEDYRDSNECSDINNHLNMDMGFTLRKTNGSGMLEDIIFSSHGHGN
ncbi:hypothetical protein F511_18925 [Dorcoceras hygrometricum]|uniref:HTH myb-type domain-containing protein n=1 Tax=Dorcoceras hygrometricum TaxID=472368 RepID=A0A2Z7AUQ6_9LAMI|nr:hypothetical protein F511_18925 [Dorcoceras hygrometricum]